MAAAVAVCATPAGIRTIAYYHGLLTNQIAARGEGLWAPLSLSAPLDLLLIIAGTGLALQFFRASPSFWERVALAPLAAMTVEASRSGVWLLFFLIPTAARAFRLRPSRDRLLSPLGAVAVAALILGIVRGPIASGASRSVVIRAITLARGTPVLAEGTIAEQVAIAGGRVWAGDPIDAFSTQRQSTYLDWVDGRHGDAALRNVDVVLVTEGSPADQLMAHAARFSVVDSSHGVWLYTRTDLLSGRKRQHPCQGSGGCHIEKNL